VDSGRRVAVALLAGGMGIRTGGGLPKPFRPVLGKPLILYSLRAFDGMPEISSIRVAIPEDYEGTWDSILSSIELRAYRGRVFGGITRSASALAVLRALEADSPDIVLIHDAARPLVSRSEVRNLVAAAEGRTGAILAARAVDTLWRVDGDGLLSDGVDRKALVRALTPQAFHYDAIRDAYERGVADGFEGTDDASFALNYGGSVAWVPGTSKNLKVTYPEDFALFEAILGGEGCA
jgi:2-C-methyl-D-erythritol 4-phosphate cytidylyltransferase/2-C-methyl-D-erythritol 2,4-cyclodiphosphate synthase